MGTRDPCCRPPSPDNVPLLDELEEDPSDGAEPLAEPTIGLKELTDQIQAMMQRLDKRAQAATKLLLEKAQELSIINAKNQEEPTSFSSQLTPMQQLLEQTAESNSQATPLPAPPVTQWSKIIDDVKLEGQWEPTGHMACPVACPVVFRDGNPLWDVRELKKEMGRLLEDPIGVAERLDQFLGPNMYTWVELQSILGILFTMEEREMIRHSGMRVWDRECQGPDQGDQKWPMQDPGWNNQNERHRQNMSDLRWMIIQGIREAVPKGQNIGKALSEHQGKDEPLADWLERLRKPLQLYSGVDPNTAAGQVLLKTQFVAKSWGHIRKKLEKGENWQDRELQELLREEQKVIQIIQYVDDLLLSGEDEVEVKEATIKLLNFLGEKGLKVLLTTEAAIRTKERGWIHASRIKGPVEEPKEWMITSEPGDTKLTLKRGLGEANPKDHSEMRGSYRVTVMRMLLTLLVLLNIKAWKMGQPPENVWVTLAKTLRQDNLCLSMGSISSPLSSCLVGIPFKINEPSPLLIHPVIQGRQMTAMPIDPELAAKGKPNPLMALKTKPTHTQKKGSKEMLTEHKETTVAQEMSIKFEKECEKLDAARETLEKLEAEMREHENLDYWEYRRNRDSVLIKKDESI
ncbi:hypothetical protein DUI87_30631 [Hirundo rustica rustica]|uniref:Core shell protein Gag P30 domain-containing protein n=1 Tax=Hirundo rustica rustica TaxID=333673 RepID=A0A3M0J1X5_HIRRU|nr:hypothetical protein DUI87_30631 [Hirundo rustica rustica]